MPYAQQLGRYQLLDRIAFGGMAEIYRAKTFDSDGRVHWVAVKRVLQHLTTDDDFLRMLVDEAKINATLRHENIARVYEFAHTGDEYFMAMEYVDGKDVRSLLERHRAAKEPIAPDHVAWIAMHVARGLDAAHAQVDGAGRSLNIVHRDVSPSNVLLGYGGEVKLCDFGIAKATLTRVQTRTGVIKGKVKYMSPEQAMGRRLDHRSDLFSLGTVIYEMLTLQAPFQAATEVELIFAVRDARKKDAREVNDKVPAELNDILNKLMLKSRSNRFQSGRELAGALESYLARNHAAYRKSAFARYMRKVFAKEIEGELRRMEEYIIENADEGDVGENLIADALGPDAEYTQFTAAVRSANTSTAAATQRFPRLERKEPTDIHAENTRILTRNQENPPTGKARFHEQRTQIIHPSDKMPPRDQSTAILSDPALHGQDTQILNNPDPAPAPGAGYRATDDDGPTDQRPPASLDDPPTSSTTQQLDLNDIIEEDE